MIKLRPYKDTDASIILSWCQSEEDFYKWTAGVLGNYPITEQAFHFVHSLFPFTAFDEDGIVGFFTLRELHDTNDELRIGFVIINPEKRRKGYGKAMLQLGLTFVFQIYGASRASLGVFENNPSAYYCYKSIGFQDVHPNDVETYHIMQEDWHCLELEIDAHSFNNKSKLEVS